MPDDSHYPSVAGSSEAGGSSSGADAAPPPGLASASSNIQSKAAMSALEAAVAQAEALEAAGKYREAAELTARAMTTAHSEYVASKVPGVKLVRAPSMAVARRSYVERYKARLRVDWQKWDRVSLYQMRLGDGGDASESGEDGDEGGGGAVGAGKAKPATSAPASAGAADDGDDRPSAIMEEDANDWQPETLAKQTASGEHSGKVELVHTCCNGTRITNLVEPTALPNRAAYRFNRDPKNTVKQLLSGSEEALGNRPYSHDEIAQWMLTANRLSKNQIGDYVGRNDDDATKILAGLVAFLDFGPFVLHEAMRFFLSLFRLPGEAQQIARIMQCFAAGYYDSHRELFRSPDTAYILAFALIMLNTDAHSAEIKKEKKMTLPQFLKNMRGIDDGADIDQGVLEELYSSIVENEIMMEQREFIDTRDVKEGWLLKQGGRIKTWKKRYVIISGNVLYYFKGFKDKAPAGYVPLEGVLATPKKDGRTFILAPSVDDGTGTIKSVRMASGAAFFSRGNHKDFRFRVVAPADSAEAWVKAVTDHAVASQVRSRKSQLDGGGSSEDGASAPKATYSFFRGKPKPKKPIGPPARKLSLLAAEPQQ